MPDIDILIEAPGWKSIPGVKIAVERAVMATLAAADLEPAGVSVMLGNDAAVRELNAQYRGKDSPTNVLSFPAPSVPGQPGIVLGDIVLAYETCNAEALAEGKTLVHHMTHLVIHGVLHLLGHNHENDAEAEVMEAQEVALLAGLGIANPYADHPEALS